MMFDVVKDKYTLMFGDCLERMKEIPDGSVYEIRCSPKDDEYQNFKH